ncbi:MAG: S9 family peptidase [Cryomorphaceae bacterium]|nr:S9 family peptidase [Cryomorphaceae bacterium]
MKKLAYIFGIIFFSFLLNAQIELPYQLPHKDILSLADAPLPPSISISNDGKKAIMIYRSPYKSIAELSQKEMRLGGLRINPVTNISSRVNYSNNITLFNPETQTETEIKGFPQNGQIAYISWSKSQDKIAFTHTTENGVTLWYIDYPSAKAHKLTNDDLNANMGNPYVWLTDESGFLVRRLPAKRKALIDTENEIPTGPVISVNEAGKEAQNRTYQDLLKSPQDETNFETLTRSEIIKVTLKGKISLWKDADLYRFISPAPNGEYYMVGTIKRPFSYIVPFSRFPLDVNILDKNGKKVHALASIPLIEDLPKGFMATQTGPRSFGWRNDKAATVYWAEALDNGDPNKEVEFRDQVFQLPAPFTGEKQPLTKTVLRYSGITWGTDEMALVSEYWWNTRTVRMSFFAPNRPNAPQKLFIERNYQDQYSDPGSFVTRKNQFNEEVLDLDENENLILIGAGHSPEGKLPFIDELNTKTMETNRLYRAAQNDQLENIIKIIDRKNGVFLTRLESSNVYPNYYLRNINDGSLQAVSKFENPFQALENVHKEVITYTREDGLQLSATLYLPVGYDKNSGKKMPMIMWAYPREYKDKSSAGQVTSSSNQFTRPFYGSPLYWINRGYVVLDNTAFPIVGEADEEPNDSFIEQLVANAKAAIDAVDAMGYIDRKRVAVGGHSYGAFMTANLLSHSDLFAAGIARSGAYNRSLTPFGFQSEERNYWEAPEVYFEMSPFSHADKMKTPLLLIHGSADNNSGTYPMQSERYFNALKGLGAPVRLVMLPNESHGYAARESIMHMLWEQDEWLEKHLKGDLD